MKRSLIIIIGGAALVASCGGGGARSVAPVAAAPSGPGQSKPASATARFTITIPAPPAGPSDRARRPQYVSSATNSLTVALAGGATTVIPLVATATAPSPCTTAASGARSCTVNLDLPAGNDTFTVSTYAQADGTGTPLSTVSMTAVLAAGASTPINLTLDAVVSALVTTVAPASFTAGQNGTAAVSVTALDAAGATIVLPPGALVDSAGHPVTIGLTDSDTSGATTLSSKTIAVGSPPVTLSYDKDVVPAPASFTITATATSSAGTIATATPFAVQIKTPQSLYVLNGSGDTVSEFALPLPAGTSTPAPRRVFGGATIGAACGGAASVPAPMAPTAPEYFTADAIAVSPNGPASGTVYVVTDAEFCGAGSVFPFSPSAGPAASPAPFAENGNVMGNDGQPTIAFDASRQLIDTSDNGMVSSPPTLAPGASGLDVANQFSLGGSLQTQVYSTSDCFVAQAAFSCPSLANSRYASSPSPAPFMLVSAQSPPLPVAVDRNGNLVVTAEDRRGPFDVQANDLNYGPPAVVLIPPGSQTSGGPLVTAPAWIEGPDTQISAPVSFAVDQNDILYVLDGDEGQPNTFYPGNASYCTVAAQGTASSPPATVQCADGVPHFYLLAFDLKALQSGTSCPAAGPCDLKPLFILGGSSHVARFQFANNGPIGSPFAANFDAGNFVPGGNMISVGDGYVAVANATGPACDANCASGLYDSTGEVDVYAVTGLSGTHFDDAQSAPVAVLPGTTAYVDVPIGVAIGPSGSATAGIAGVRRAATVHGRHPLSKRFRRR